MRLIINGKEAQKGMEVTTFRGETYILDGWRAPGERFGGMNGKVYCIPQKDYENNTPNFTEWYPGVIGGKFVKTRTIIISAGMTMEFEAIRTDAPDDIILKQLEENSSMMEELIPIPDSYGTLKKCGYFVDVLGNQDTLSRSEIEADREFDFYDL